MEARGAETAMTRRVIIDSEKRRGAVSRCDRTSGRIERQPRLSDDRDHGTKQTQTPPAGRA